MNKKIQANIFIIFMTLLACGSKNNVHKNNITDSLHTNPAEASIDQLNTMIEKEPNNAEYLYYRGLYYQDQEDYKLAIDDFNRSIVNDSTSETSWCNRANCKLALDDFEGAIDDYTKAIQLKPTYYEAYYNRGTLYDSKKDYETAINDYTMAVELKPDFTEAYYNRGVNYFLMKKKDKACEDFKKASDLGDEQAKDAYQKNCIASK